jgi:hypothetical protein
VRGHPDEHVSEVGEHVDLGTLARLDEGVDHGRSPPAAHAAGEQPVLATDGHGAYGALNLVVVDWHQAFAQELAQLPPLLAHVFHGFGHEACVAELSPHPSYSRDDLREDPFFGAGVLGERLMLGAQGSRPAKRYLNYHRAHIFDRAG